MNAMVASHLIIYKIFNWAAEPVKIRRPCIFVAICVSCTPPVSFVLPDALQQSGKVDLPGT